MEKNAPQNTKRGISERHQPPHASSHGINLVVSCTSSEARRLRSCTRTLPEMLSHQGTCRLWRGKKRLRNVAKNLFFLGGFFLHFEAELLIFLHEAKSIQQLLSPPQIFCQKKEASPLSFFIIVFARINTRTTYTLRSGKQPTLKKKSPREEDICVHK